MRVINEFVEVDTRLGHKNRFRYFDHPATVVRTSEPVDERSLEIADEYLMIVAEIARGETKELRISGRDEMNYSPPEVLRRKAVWCTDVHIERRLRYQAKQIQSRDMREVIGLPFHAGGNYRVSIRKMKIDAPHF